MQRVLTHYKNNTIGSELDFAPATSNRDYYLGNILKVAIDARETVSLKKVKDTYKSINYTVNKTGGLYK